jgi:hypothetical protein
MREVMDGAMVAAAAAVAAEQHQLVKEAMACTTKVSHDVAKIFRLRRL